MKVNFNKSQISVIRNALINEEIRIWTIIESQNYDIDHVQIWIENLITVGEIKNKLNIQYFRE